MTGDLIEFERFHVREWLRFREARNWIESRARARADDYVGAAKSALSSIGQRDLYGARADEATSAENEFSASFFVIV